MESTFKARAGLQSHATNGHRSPLPGPCSLQDPSLWEKLQDATPVPLSVNCRKAYWELGLLGTFIIEDKESHSGIAEDQEGKDTARP